VAVPLASLLMTKCNLRQELLKVRDDRNRDLIILKQLSLV
jgi:hypothetical protein